MIITTFIGTIAIFIAVVDPDFYCAGRSIYDDRDQEGLCNFYHNYHRTFDDDDLFDDCDDDDVDEDNKEGGYFSLCS